MGRGSRWEGKTVLFGSSGWGGGESFIWVGVLLSCATTLSRCLRSGRRRRVDPQEVVKKIDKIVITFN